MISLLFLTLHISSLIAQSHQTKQNVSSVTLEEDNLDDSITEIFNICKCVIFYLCDEENFIIPKDQIRTSKVLINTSLRRVKRIRCSNEYYYCCKNRNETLVQTASPTRIVKSTQSQQLIDKFPWMTAVVRKRQNNKEKFKCGGSFIHSRVVLTQQQCVYSSEPSDIRIVTDRETLGSNMKMLTVSKIIKHESYNIQNLNVFDIALIILQNSVTNVKTISLPRSYQTFTGKKCTTVGWRTTSGRKHLHENDTPILDQQSCQGVLMNSSLGWNYQLHSSNLCVSADAESCKDEGGGPLICEENGAYFQAGIVSRKVKCQAGGGSELYTNVAYLLNWIKDKLRRENIQLM